MATTAPALNRDHLIEQAHARGAGRSQATVVEQSRAIAEVQGALIVADRRPRDRQKALAEALESCRTQEVASHAFFKFPRGGQSVSGPSIHLARELARCWGNVVYSVVELDRDDDRAVSEMMAYAWDLETNTRAQLQFLVPHKRDKRGGAEVLTDMRDIYENNANMGARRLRECIFAVLPPYLTKSAEDQCFRTLQEGADDKPLPVRINEAIEAFAKIAIDKKRIEARLGPVARFTEVDLANLRITYQSIQRGEVRADDEFPKIDGLTAEKLIESTAPAQNGKQNSTEASGMAREAPGAAESTVATSDEVNASTDGPAANEEDATPPQAQPEQQSGFSLGEQIGVDEPQQPEKTAAEEAVEKVIASADAARTPAALEKIIAAAEEHKQFMPNDLAVKLEIAFDRNRNRLQPAEQTELAK